MSKGQSRPVDPDAELMLAAKAGDQAAFRRLFDKYAGRIVAFSDRFFHNRAVSEEVTQEVFLRIYRARKRYEPRAKFTTWLYTVATRTCLNELRRREHQVPALELDDGRDHGAPGGFENAEQVLVGQQLQQRLQATLDGLPDNQRLALVLSRFERRSYIEVAEIMGVSESAVKSLVFRAAQALKAAADPMQHPSTSSQRAEVGHEL
jgi:RNA polymerase sigma-70 factor (ECF subfamily)